jgi:3-methyl-2-oxobutanoate hydroxymethyltransferase
MSATVLEVPRKVTPSLLFDKKSRREKIVCLTASDYPLARLLDQAEIDLLLVGDSLGMTRLGYESTLPVTLEEMLVHLKAVRRAAKRALLVADMPFASFQVSSRSALENALRLVKEGGAEAVKLEGGRKYVRWIERMVSGGVPVMGHIGLLPQSVHVMGGYKTQGRTLESTNDLMEDALALQQAGAFALVLEGMTREAAREITERLQVPTIGIGAGIHCDGQILVTEDLLGLGFTRKPRFARRYADLNHTITEAVLDFRADCLSERFPSEEETYSMDDGKVAATVVTHRANR